MRKLVLVIILVFAVYSVNGQGYSTMSQEQLNFALEKANKKIGTGSALTILGVITTGAGVALYVNGLTEMTRDLCFIGRDWSYGWRNPNMGNRSK
jgi:uncharacterized membrane protein